MLPWTMKVLLVAAFMALLKVALTLVVVAEFFVLAVGEDDENAVSLFRYTRFT